VLTDAASLAARVLVPLDVRTREVKVDGVRCVWMWPAAFETPADCPAQLLYVHGGAFCLGSPETHIQLTCQIAKRANVAVLSPEYRRCPEAAITDAHEDVLAAYKYMAEGGGALLPEKTSEEEEGNQPPKGNHGLPKLMIGGESAGANIALAVALKIRQGRVPLPQAKGLALMSPWADLRDAIEREKPSWEENETNDFVLAGLAELFTKWVLAAQKFGGISASDKEKLESLDRDALLEIASHEDVSPALAKDLSGLPNTLVTVGSCETLRDSQLAFVDRLMEAGVEVELELLKDMPHAVGLANFAASKGCPAPIDVVDRFARFVDECCGIKYVPPPKYGCCGKCCCSLQ